MLTQAHGLEAMFAKANATLEAIQDTADALADVEAAAAAVERAKGHDDELVRTGSRSQRTSHWPRVQSRCNHEDRVCECARTIQMRTRVQAGPRVPHEFRLARQMLGDRAMSSVPRCEDQSRICNPCARSCGASPNICANGVASNQARDMTGLRCVTAGEAGGGGGDAEGSRGDTAGDGQRRSHGR